MIPEVKKEIIAFLNTKGGTIYVGVSDDGTIVPFTDNAERDEMNTKVGNWIQDTFYPYAMALIRHYFNVIAKKSPPLIFCVGGGSMSRGVQTYRKPGLVRILDKLGYVENFGTGIPRIMDAYSESEKEPIFQSTDQFLSLYLPDMNDLVSDPVSDPVNRQISASLSDFDLLLMKTINDYPGLRVPGIMKVMTAERKDITENRIKNSLKRGLKNYVEFIGAAKTEDIT